MKDSLLWLFLLFFRLGVFSFGGPTAHLAFFRSEFVEKKKWLDEGAFANLVALCQLLPGPASSQVGMAIGYIRGGWWGSILAWIGFTLPAAILLTGIGYGLSLGGLHPGWLLGWKIAALVVVASAVHSMWKQLCPDGVTKLIALLSFSILLVSEVHVFVVFLLGAIFGGFFLRKRIFPPWALPIASANRSLGGTLLLAFFLLLLYSPFFFSLGYLGKSFSIFYSTGALVFGGGHVVLPLLEGHMLAQQWISKETFLAGYGLTQAMPGPLFSFSAFLGTFVPGFSYPWVGALVCLFFLFLPSFLVLFGVLPFLKILEKRKGIQAVIVGINAAVVGLLMDALYDQAGKNGFFHWKELSLVLVSLFVYRVFRLPPWLLVGALGILTRYVSFGE